MERTITVRTELESILVEQALAMARELEALTDAAPDGAVLAVGETAAVRMGRELTRVALEASPGSARPPRPRRRGPPAAQPAPRAAAAAPRTARRGRSWTAAGRSRRRRPVDAVPRVRHDGLLRPTTGSA